MKKTVSQYSKVFGPDNKNWVDDEDRNLMFVKCVQHHANNELRLSATNNEGIGFLLLNKVYDYLGFERNSEYSKVGWKYDETDRFCDNFVDFGILNGIRDDGTIVLDFNVDGQIIY